MPADSGRRPPAIRLSICSRLCVSVPSAVRSAASRSRTASNLRPAGHATAGTPGLRRSRNTSTRGLPVVLRCKPLGPSVEHRRDDAVDMLAGAEPVDAVVDAAARIGLFSQPADFHLVAGAAHRMCTKSAETGMAGFASLDRQDLLSTAPAPQRDFMLVAGVPARRRGRPVEPSFRPELASGISLGRWCRGGRVAWVLA
jgi:hypothetical protein